jgi:CHRD domain
MKNWLGVVSLGVVTGLAASAVADDREKQAFRADLVSFNEVPAVSSPARGEFRAHVDDGGASFTFELTYENLSFNASQAHIHFGQHHTNGGISVWLCQSVLSPATGPTASSVAMCPEHGTTMPITRTITALDVVGPGGQGIAAMDFAELLTAMRAGAAYANVHSNEGGTPPVGFPGGEIRGQIN